ncbi:MAG TPA: ABC transporter ATP-binding protein, partial [Casimicrobium sp.]|nr:ABC transporter ATP-binding protein [Casimicrobium sp.]
MSALLNVESVCAGYGASNVLFDVNLTIREGEVATLLGRNGMGKSTLVKCLCGWLKPAAGSITFAGQNVTAAPAHVIGKLGLGLVPEGRQVFPTLTVRENLIATASTANGNAWNLDRVITFFPRLGERINQLAGTLSGGEQQMLAIGRALMTNPRLLILDEATEGLAPLVRADIWRALAKLKEEKLAMLVIDKDLRALLPLANHHTG